MKRLPVPEVLIRQWLQNPHAITVAAFVLAGVFLGIAGWLILRNLRHNEPGLRAPLALPFALIISAAGIFGTWRLPSPWNVGAGAVICVLVALLFYYADHCQWSVTQPARSLRIVGKSFSRLPSDGTGAKPTGISFSPATPVSAKPPA